MSNSLSPRSVRMLRIGLAAGATSAALFALNLTFARLSYRYGTSVHALNLTRSLLLLILLAGFCRFRRIDPLPDPRTRVWLIVIGALMAAQLYALVGALAYAAVGLVLIIFFTYPIIVTLAEQFLARSVPPIALPAALLVAFAGLAMVLGPKLDSISYRGLSLAACAAVLFSALVMTSARTMQRCHPALAMAWMMLITCIAVAITALFNALVWPSAFAGWVALGVSAVLFCIATVLFFVSIHSLGPTRAAILDNTAPVWGICWGLIILGERFAGLQIAGAALVVAGVIAAQVIAARSRASH